MTLEQLEQPDQLNIADRFLDARVREGLGDKVALRVDSRPDEQGDCTTRELTYRDVQRLADRFAAVLARLGAEAEQRVLLALPDGAEMVGALFGTLKMGGVAVMVNPELPADQLARLFDYSRARVAVTDAGRSPQVAEAAAAGRWPRRLLDIGSGEGGTGEGGTGEGGTGEGGDGEGSGAGGHASFAAESRGLPQGFTTEPTHPDDPAIWLFSGGTTGRPKAVVQTHRSFANTTELYGLGTLAMSAEDVTLSIPKLYFGYATGSNLFFPFAAGATVVLFPDHPTPEVVFDKIRRHRPTVLVNVPTLINRMVSHPRAAEADLSCLRLATSAGEALPVALHERWRELFGVELLDGLGTAEMWHIFISNRPGEVLPGTLGKVVDGFTVEVRDPDGRRLDEPGAVGRMWVRGDSLALGYWQEIERSRDAFRGRWYASGDLISRDEQGWVRYHGRADDVLKVGGKWLVPGEVESCLLTHPRVKECAVIGVTDTAGLTKPHAYVVLAQGGASDGDATDGDTLAEALKAHVLERLAPYKHPRELFFVDDLPRTHLGKVDRGKLRRRSEESAGEAGG